MSIGQELISQETISILNEIQSYLNGVSIEFVVTSEVEKVNLSTLGNELQKKYKVIDDLRKKEKSTWDEKAKEVQTYFVGFLNKIDMVKSSAARAIQKWNEEQEEIRRKKQIELVNESNRKRSQIESLAMGQAERAEMYRQKSREANIEAEKETDIDRKNQLIRDSVYFNQKAIEFETKSNSNSEIASQIVEPIYQPEYSCTNKGTRTTKEYSVVVLSKKDFLKYCLDNNELQFIEVVESKIKARIKEKEGDIKIPGISFSITEKVGFSGR